MGTSQSISELSSQASKAAWQAFDELDDDMSGTISKSEFKHMLIQKCESGGLAIDEVEAEADVLWDAVDSKQRGVVDAEEWGALVILVQKWRKRREREKAIIEKRRTTLEVIAPGAIARTEVSLSSKRVTKLGPGRALQELDRAWTTDGVERICVQWYNKKNEEEGIGWISAKTVRHCVNTIQFGRTTDALLRSGRWGDLVEWLVLEQGKYTNEEIALKKNGVPGVTPEIIPGEDDQLPQSSLNERRRSDSSSSINHTQSFALLTGNLKFLKDFEPERLCHLSSSLRRLVGNSEVNEQNIPHVLRTLETKMGEHQLSIEDRSTLREALLGESGVAWRRSIEQKIAQRFEICCQAIHAITNKNFNDTKKDFRRAQHRARAARALHAAGIAKTPDPNLLTIEAIQKAASRLDSMSGSQILALSHWASADELLRSPQVTAWFEARDKTHVAQIIPYKKDCPHDARTSLLNIVPIALKENPAKDPAKIRTTLLDLYSSISVAHFASDAPRTVRRIWLCSDLHVDFEANMRHVLDFVPHPSDALIVAGDVAPTIAQFTKVMKSLVAKFALVFFCPGNHCLWVQRSENQTSLAKFFELLYVCDTLGVITYPVHVGENAYIAPLFSWYNPAFVDTGTTDQLSRHRLRFFDATCLWPTFLDDDQATDEKSNDVSCTDTSLVPGISQFFRTLNQPAIQALRTRLDAPDAAPAIVISFSHFLPQRQLFEGPGGVRILGHVMGDESIAHDIYNVKALIHCFGHSHLNVDTVLSDGVRYVQNALGHQDAADAGKPLTFQPIIIWDSEYAQPVPPSPSANTI